MTELNTEQRAEYKSHVRGAATFILLHKADPPMNAQELVRLYNLDLETVTADINEIVESERHKTGGVFEGDK